MAWPSRAASQSPDVDVAVVAGAAGGAVTLELDDAGGVDDDVEPLESVL